MKFKKDIEKLLFNLKLSNIDRDTIEKALRYSPNYIDQVLAKGGNKTFYDNLKEYSDKVLQKDINVALETSFNEEQAVYQKATSHIPVFEHGPGTKPDFWWKGIPRLNDCDHAIRAKGVSMASLIREGSIVIGKELFNKEKIVMGEIYIIKTMEQEYIRYVNQHPEKEDFFILSPYNQKAGMTVLNKDDVIKLYEYRATFQFA